MKKCSSCKIEKELSFFNKKGKRKDGTQRYQTFCRICNGKYLKKHYDLNKLYYLDKANKNNQINRKNVILYLKEYAKEGCILCGEKDFACIQFDHIKPEQKSYNISSMVKLGHSIDKIKEELEKCNVLCANCHAKRTAKQFNWYKYLD